MTQTHKQPPAHGPATTLLWLVIGVYVALLLLGAFRRWPGVELVVLLAVGLALFVNLLHVSKRRWTAGPAALHAGGIALTTTLGFFWLDVLPGVGRGLSVAGLLLTGLTVWSTTGESTPAAPQPRRLQSGTAAHQRWTTILIVLSVALQIIVRPRLASAAALTGPSVSLALIGILYYWLLRTRNARPICACIAVSIALSLVAGWHLLITHWRADHKTSPAAVALFGVGMLLMGGVTWWTHRSEYMAASETGSV